MIKISLVDDELLFLNGLKEILSKQEDFKIHSSYTNSIKFVEDWKSSKRKPDVVLVDMNVPEINGMQLTQFIIDSNPEVKVVGLSSHYTKVLIYNMLKLGASSYLPKNVPIDQLLKTIRRVHNEGIYFDDVQLKNLNTSYDIKDQQELLYHGLSTREIDVLLLICDQCTTQEIADKLFISYKTVERHRTKLFEKTQAKNVVGLVLFALKHKFVEKVLV